jgi:hypothetical protein
MKIKYALTSCDSNPLYYQFWPTVAKLWKEYIGIDPILIFIGSELPKDMNEDHGQIILFEPIENLPTSTQSQFIRLWYTQFLDDVVITTDIDMLPLSRGYFRGSAKNISDDKFLHLGFEKTLGFSICYNVAKPQTFKEVLNLSNNFEQDIMPLYSELKAKNKKEEWFSDEEYLTRHLRKAGDRLVKFDRGENYSQTRINRTNWNYHPSLVSAGAYYDCHSIRPYKQYKQEIDRLINYIL